MFSRSCPKFWLVIALLALMSVAVSCATPGAEPKPVVEAPTPTDAAPVAQAASPEASGVTAKLVVTRKSVYLDGIQVDGGTVARGSKIETDGEGYARLIFYDDPGIYTDIRAGTSLAVEDLDDSQIRLYQSSGSTLNVLETTRSIVHEVVFPAGRSTMKSTQNEVRFDVAGGVYVACLEGPCQVVDALNNEVELQTEQRVFLPEGKAAGPPEKTAYVAIDRSHQGPLVWNFQWFHEVFDRSPYFTLVEISDLNTLTLERHRVLILPHPAAEFSEEEIVNVQKWVESGGGLFLIGEYPYGGAFPIETMNRLLGPFKIQFHLDRKGVQDTAQFEQSHPAVNYQVAELPLSGYGFLVEGERVATVPPETAITVFGSEGERASPAGADAVVMASYEDQGRVLVSADANPFIQNWSDEAGPFLDQAVKWLAGIE